jgi:hypothetical protein
VGGVGGALTLWFGSESRLGTAFLLDEAGPVSLSRFEDELILVTANNAGPDVATATLLAQTSFWVRSIRPPVPEAATRAQLMVGLASLAFLAIARRRGQAR